MLPLTINNVPIKVKMARTGQEQQRGLMFVSSLPQDEGMLFCHPKPQPMSFWMKNVKIPLSIAFINKNGKIISIRDMSPGSLESVKSPIPCRWALEMNQGWFDKHGIKAGATVDYCKKMAEKPKNIIIKIVK